MIITQAEIGEFARAIEEFDTDSAWSRAIGAALAESGGLRNPRAVADATLAKLTREQRKQLPVSHADTKMLGFLRNRPQLLIPSGFDEIRIEPDPAKQLAKAMHEESKRRGYEPSSLSSDKLPFHAGFEFMLGVHCRDAATGSWYRSAYIEQATGKLCLRPATGTNVRSVSFQDLLRNCSRAINEASHPAVLLLPNLWRAPSSTPCIHIAEASRELALALKRQDTSLKDISWQQLEDVVAEVLRHRGFQIQVTPRSRDGGRDIIARGEMIPGEPCIVAVEVKHRPVVKIDEIRSHLQANKDFPMLLVATSGKFSAAVVREKTKPENFLRLHLRDHQALSAWISEYS